MALQKPIVIDKLNQGGISDSIYAGAANSVAKLTGFDIHSEPGVTKVRQKLTKDSGAVVDEFCKVKVVLSNGDIYWFSSTSGKIWKVGAPYTLVHTTTPIVGDASCLGAFEYGGYLYWCTENRGHRIPVNTITLADWATYAEEDILELNLDQEENGGITNTYTLQSSLSESATRGQFFTPVSTPLESVGVNVVSNGSGDWTLKVHDVNDVELGTVTRTNAQMIDNAWNFFEFATPLNLTKNTEYHIHVYDTTADGTVMTSTTNDFRDANVRYYTTSDSEFHPMITHFGVLYIGDKNFVHQVEEQVDGEHIFTTQALDLEEPYRVKCLGKAPFDLLIGTIISNNVSRCNIYRWDTYSESFTSSDEIPEVGINAFIPADNYIFVHAGIGGNIYVYDGNQLQLYRKIQGNYTPTAKITIHPNAVGMLDGLTLFGVSNVTGNPADQGVYVLGHYSRDYPVVYDLSYPISERSGGALVTSSIEIGAIAVKGFDLYVSWKNGSSFGIDKLDYSNKLELAYLESLVMIPERSTQQNFGRFILGYRGLPTGTSFAAKQKLNHATSWTSIESFIKDTDRKIYASEQMLIGNTLQIRVEATVSSNDAPEFESMGIYPTQ